MSTGEEASSPGYNWVVQTTARAINSSITALTSDYGPTPGSVTHSADSATGQYYKDRYSTQFLQLFWAKHFPSSCSLLFSDYYEDFAEERDAGQESNASLVGVSVLAGALSVILSGLFIRWVVRKARDRRNRGSLGQLTVVSVGESRGNQSGILATDWRDQLNPFSNSS